jgi:hypothetical protein
MREQRRSGALRLSEMTATLLPSGVLFGHACGFRLRKVKPSCGRHRNSKESGNLTQIYQKLQASHKQEKATE